MRVLVAHTFYRLPGGEDRYVEQLVDLLGRQHDVELLRRSNRDLSGNVEAVKRLFFSPSERDKIRKVVRRYRPDVIHLNNPYPSLGPSVHVAARSENVPLVLTVHNYRLRCPNGYMFTQGSVCRRCEGGAYYNAVLHRCFEEKKQAVSYAAALWTHRFIMRLDASVTLLVAMSEFVRNALLAWGFPEERTVVVRNFTDHPPLSQPRDPGKFGIYVGRISPEKGIHILLEALRLAGDPPFRIVGEGPQRGQLEELARRLRLKRTEFIGQVPPRRVANLLENSRYAVLPSLGHETSCLSGVEALAAGRPVIATAMGALPELVANGEGLLCRAGDPREMADKIKVFARNDDRCRAAGIRGIELVRRSHVPEVHLAALTDAYKTAISIHKSALAKPHKSPTRAATTR